MDAIDNYLEEQVDKLTEVEDLEDFYNQCEQHFFNTNDDHDVWEELMAALAETPIEVQKNFWIKFLKQRADLKDESTVFTNVSDA